MPDYYKHVMKNWEWCNEYRSQMGKEAYNKYVSDVYKLLLGMKPKSFFSIEKNVKPENRDLFIKVCCMFIQEQYQYDFPEGVFHLFNAYCSEIQCNTLLSSKNNSNKSNTVTKWYQ